MIGFTTVLGGLITYSIEVEHNPNMNSVADGLWWALVTVTTVGFGDIAPVSGFGRVVGGILMLIGMVNLGLFASIVGHTLPAALMKLREEQFRMSRHINHWVVCGYEEGSEMFLRTLLNELDGSQRVLLFGLAVVRILCPAISNGLSEILTRKVNYTNYALSMRRG